MKSSELDPYLSWHRPDVAAAMRALVVKELSGQDYTSHPPYKYFLLAIRWLAAQLDEPIRLLDVGCGVGHYSRLTDLHCPGVIYTGIDFSPSMIEEARKLFSGQNFIVADATKFDFSGYDVVLASSLIEVMDDWKAGARGICESAGHFVILNRVRHHGGKTVRNDDEGYPSQPTYCHIHDLDELEKFFAFYGFTWVKSWMWTEMPQATIIFRKNNGQT